VIASAKFAEQSPDEMEELGEFEVAGFAAAQTAYGLRDEAGSGASAAGTA
jgi:hypothetical protein